MAGTACSIPAKVTSRNGKTYRVHLRDLPHPPHDARLRGLVRGDEQSLGHRHRPGGVVLRERLRDRPPLAPGRDRLLHPPGRALSAVYLADRIDRGPLPSEGGLLRNPLFRQPRLSGGISRPALHGQHPRQLRQRRRAGSQRLDLPAPRRSPISCGPTTPGSCRSCRRPAPTAASTSSTGTIAITAIRTPAATPRASTGLKGGSTACGTKTRRGESKFDLASSERRRR